MIRYTVKEFAQERGISTAYQLQKALNIAPSQAAHCFANLSIREGTLDKLCEYFNCQPGDLMRYEPNQPEPVKVAPKPRKSRKS